MGFWPYFRHAHRSSGPETPPSATGTSRTTFFTWLFLLLLHQIKHVRINHPFIDRLLQTYNHDVYLLFGRLGARPPGFRPACFLTGPDIEATGKELRTSSQSGARSRTEDDGVMEKGA
jgi:hypothetical protein